MEKCCKIAGLYLATLRAIYFIHQQNHWLAKGQNFYGNHLLFQRLYESAQNNADLAAEKFIGLFGEDGIELSFQTELFNKIINRYKSLSKNPIAMSLAIEKEFLKLSEDAYNLFKKEGVMTLGLDDMIMSIASNREESVYLLQQINKK
jgi:DNA-binding ferritin-like protein